MTGKSGTYTLSSLPAGSYTITPSDGVIQFTPKSRGVVVARNVTAVNFTDPLPVLKTGKIIYPCTNGICQKDLATGIEKTAVDLSATSEQPIILVPFKKSARVVYPSIKTDVNPLLVAPGDGDWITSLLPASTPQKVIWAAVNLTGAYKCMNPEEMFDVINTTQGGDIMVTPVFCWASNLNGIITQDIFIVKLNGKEEFIQVTNNKKWEYSPVFAGTDKNGNMRILFAQEKGTGSGDHGTILEQVVNMTNKNKPTLVGSPTVFAKNIIADTNYGRDISVNANYTAYFPRIQIADFTDFPVWQLLVFATKA